MSRRLKAAMRDSQLAFDFGIEVVDADEARRARNREMERRWRAANREKYLKMQRERDRRWRAANPGKYLEVRRQRRAANPEKHRQQNKKRRARKKGNGIFTVTQRDLRQLLNRQQGHCAWCDISENLHLDHIIPIARGGTHGIGNFQYLCQNHNLSKGASTRTEWLKRSRQDAA